jgi:hypothetical protein
MTLKQQQKWMVLASLSHRLALQSINSVTDTCSACSVWLVVCIAAVVWPQGVGGGL